MEAKVKVRLTLHEDRYAEEVRCNACHALLFKAHLTFAKARDGSQAKLGIEVKCRRCGQLNQF